MGIRAWRAGARTGIASTCLMLTTLLLCACERPRPAAPLILNDFETAADLEQIAWRCRTTFSLSELYRSHGQSALLMTLYPDAYPGLHLLLTPQMRQWRGYRYLALDITNPASTPVFYFFQCKGHLMFQVLSYKNSKK